MIIQSLTLASVTAVIFLSLKSADRNVEHNGDNATRERYRLQEMSGEQREIYPGCTVFRGQVNTYPADKLNSLSSRGAHCRPYGFFTRFEARNREDLNADAQQTRFIF